MNFRVICNCNQPSTVRFSVLNVFNFHTPRIYSPLETEIHECQSCQEVRQTHLVTFAREFEVASEYGKLHHGSPSPSPSRYLGVQFSSVLLSVQLWNRKQASHPNRARSCHPGRKCIMQALVKLGLQSSAQAVYHWWNFKFILKKIFLLLWLCVTHASFYLFIYLF